MAGEKTGWEKATGLLHDLGAALIAAAVTLVGTLGTCRLSKHQERESMLRAQVELISQRESADTQLRKDMFQSIFEKYLQPKKRGFDERILNLELLAYNFHDSIDLGPLYEDLCRRLQEKCTEGEYANRLKNLAEEVNASEAAMLEKNGAQKSISAVFFDDSESGYIADFSMEKKMGGPECEQEHEKDIQCQPRTFTVQVMNYFPATRELLVNLLVSKPGRTDLDLGETMTIGLFSFPTIRNYRLSYNQRCALYLTRFDPKGGAELTLLYFPGTYAALKDKQEIDDLVKNMTRELSKHAGKE